MFTPDDEVSANGETYLQARPNFIEIGWFFGRLGRTATMLLLKEGTRMFSDSERIIQKRFAQNVAEKVLESKKDLVAAKSLAAN